MNKRPICVLLGASLLMGCDAIREAMANNPDVVEAIPAAVGTVVEEGVSYLLEWILGTTGVGALVGIAGLAVRKNRKNKKSGEPNAPAARVAR